MPTLPPLPIDPYRPRISELLRKSPVFLLEAPPGTGKSTRVPLWALDALPGRVLLLEPRRAAARMLARHLANLTGGTVGGLVGIAMRQETRVSRSTRLLVVTEGVFTRMITDEQSLSGVSCVLFDEFHERSIASDTGLALALESQSILRPDLHLGILSATLDRESLKKILPDAPEVVSPAPGYPVRTVYAPDRTPGLFSLTDRLRHLPLHMAGVILNCLRETSSSVLAFLPGSAEIRRTAEALEGQIPEGCAVFPLLGNLSAREQDAALAPAPEGQRKIVLATDIAETSLTIQGVSTVVDSGLQRRPRWDAASGRTRLVTQTIPLSSARQRQGRAGRLCPGLCVRLWSRESEKGMAPFARPEILEADLTPLAMDLALWGAAPGDLSFVTPPPAAAMESARRTLSALGILDREGRITPFGRDAAALAIDPRPACALAAAKNGSDAALAALACACLEEDDTAKHTQTDITPVLDAVLGRKRPGAARILDFARVLLNRRKRSVPTKNRGQEDPENCAARLLRSAGACGRVLLPGFADRIAMRQDGCGAGSPAPGGERQSVYLLRGGSRVLVPAASPLAGSKFILALDTRGQAGSGYQILNLGASLAENDLTAFAKSFLRRETSVTADRNGKVQVRERLLLDSIVLEDRMQPDPDPEAIRAALLALVKKEGISLLSPDDRCREWQARVLLLRRLRGKEWPDLSDEGLAACLDDWLPPLLEGVRDLRKIPAGSILRAWQGLLPWNLAKQLESLAPVLWKAPSGREHPISYTGDGPRISVKLQECFGLTASPVLPCGAPVTLLLTSPSGAPLAATRDLAFFWKEAYPSVRAEMRGRYPKHPWTENPLEALPTAFTNRKLAAMAAGKTAHDVSPAKKKKR